MKTNIFLLILFIFSDYTGIWNLWSENVYRRILHHLQSNYDYNKKPLVHIFKNGLTLSDVKYLNNILYTKVGGITSKSHVLSSLFGGHYSQKNTLYYNDFNSSTQSRLDYIGNKNLHSYEKISKFPLSLGNSSFRGTILMYAGKNSGFTYHYDTEETNCFRTIYLINKRGKIPPFSYYNEQNELVRIHLNIGDGIFFRGTTTYHGIEKLNNDDSLRYVSGWQYCGDNMIKEKSICSELRGASISEIFYTFFPLILFTNIAIQTLNKICYFQYGKRLHMETLIISLVNIYVYPFFITDIGYGRTSTISQLTTFYFVCLLVNITNYHDGMLLFNYILLTEMLFT